MSKFTVILMRPDYMETDTAYGQDIYVAHITTTDLRAAITIARQEVFDADDKDDLNPNDSDDYALVAVFDGHITPILYGWQE